MKPIAFIFCNFICLLGINANAVELAQINNKKLARILINAEIVAEQNKPPISVRLIRVQDSGECDGNPQSCPKQIVYIAVSTFDEAPEQKVYVLPKSYGWEFVRWKDVPKEEGANHFVVFEAKEKIISTRPDKDWWAEKSYEIGINPWGSFIRVVQHKK